MAIVGLINLNRFRLPSLSIVIKKLSNAYMLFSDPFCILDFTTFVFNTWAATIIYVSFLMMPAFNNCQFWFCTLCLQFLLCIGHVMVYLSSFLNDFSIIHFLVIFASATCKIFFLQTIKGISSLLSLIQSFNSLFFSSTVVLPAENYGLNFPY